MQAMARVCVCGRARLSAHCLVAMCTCVAEECMVFSCFTLSSHQHAWFHDK